MAPGKDAHAGSSPPPRLALGPAPPQSLMSRLRRRRGFKPDRPPRRRRRRRSPRTARFPRLALSLALLGVVVGLVTLVSIIGSAFSSPLRAVASVTQTDSGLGQWMKGLDPVDLRPAARGRVTAAPNTITIDPAEPQQTFWGVGGAVTDSSAYLIQNLPPATRRRLLKRLYGSSGLGLSFGVVPIGASDFTASGQPYTYDDLRSGQADPTLSRFSLGHDARWNLPVLEEIARIAPKIRFFAAPWTAPAWMKSNDALDDVGFKGTLMPRYYAAFASYLVAWLTAYTEDGVNVAAIAPENEPNSPSAFPSMSLPESAEATFIHYDLAPALTAADLSTKIFGGDVGLTRLPYQADLIAGRAGKDLGGLAWHCYSAPPTQLALAAHLDPSLTQIIAECATNLSKFPIQENVIGALENGASAYAAWNDALTASGGPVQKPNSGCGGCRGLVTIDPGTGGYSLSEDAYVLGQIGHFVTPGAVRLATTDEPNFYKHGGVDGLDPDGILNVAYADPDGRFVLVTFNSTATAQTVHVTDGTDQFTTRLPAGAMTTFTWHSDAPRGELRTLMNRAHRRGTAASVPLGTSAG